MRPISGFFSMRGEPLGDNVEAWKKDIAEPITRPAHPIRVASERRSVTDPREKFIKNTKGEIIGKIGGGNPVPQEHMPKKVTDSITPYYDSLLNEDRHAKDIHKGIWVTGDDKNFGHLTPKGSYKKESSRARFRNLAMYDPYKATEVVKKMPKYESQTPFYDSLVQEDMTTADVASMELPLRNGGLSQQFDKELDRRRKKKYYKLAMISASMGGAGGSY